MFCPNFFFLYLESYARMFTQSVTCRWQVAGTVDFMISHVFVGFILVVSHWILKASGCREWGNLPSECSTLRKYFALWQPM